MVHKIHSGAKCILPQESLEDFQIETDEVLTVTGRVRGGARLQSDEDSNLIRITTFLSSKTLPWKEAEKAVKLLWAQARPPAIEKLIQAKSDGELAKQIRSIVKEHGLGMQNFFPQKSRRTNQAKPVQARMSNTEGASESSFTPWVLEYDCTALQSESAAAEILTGYPCWAKCRTASVQPEIPPQKGT